MLGPLRILHVDMDAFFASVEQLDNPALRGRAVLVGGAGPRGVISAASYEARKFGCRSAQPTAVAMRLCPQAVVVKGNHGRYAQISRQVRTIFETFTPLVQAISIDEAFLDVAGTEQLFGPPVWIAQQIKNRIFTETGLTASVGVAPNKFLAKLATDLNKPDGMTVISEDDVDRVLPSLAVEKIWGVGPKTAERLAGVGIRTIGDLRNAPLDILKAKLGVDEAEHYLRLAHGIDGRAVTPDREAKSVGHEQTFGHNLTDPQAVRDVILDQAEQVGSRLRRHGMVARTVTVKIRYGDFQTITRRSTLKQPTDTTHPIWVAARDLFDAWAAREFRPVRLIGVSVGQLSFASEGQLPLFVDPKEEKAKRLDETLDAINAKFGKRSVRRGTTRD